MFAKLFITISFIGLTTAGYADPASDNPFMELYKLRIGINAMNVQRQQALLALADAKYARTARLVQTGAVSREEYDIALSDKKVAEAEVGLSQKRVLEAKAYLLIVEGLVQAKKPIPICTTEME